MHGRFLILAIVLLFSSTFSEIGFAQESTIRARMHWPPLFQRTFGEPKVSVSVRKLNLPTKLVYFRPTNKVILKVNGKLSEAEINRLIRQKFLQYIWDEYLTEENQLENEARLGLEEIIPMSKSIFFSSGHRWLAHKTTGNELLDCWWKVRGGEPLTLSRDYTLGFSTIIWADSDKNSFGHYSFCLRKRGGDPKRDAMFDFRAPWNKDHRPSVTDGLNLNNSLKIAASRENLYDWMYTQANFRNVKIRLRFVHIHEEQVKLLQAFSGFQQGGNFKVFKQNCASMGSLFAQRLLPLDISIAKELSLADLPLLASDRSVKRFGGGKVIADVTLNNRTITPTNKTEIRRAPNRMASHGYRYLMTVPEIN